MHSIFVEFKNVTTWRIVSRQKGYSLLSFVCLSISDDTYKMFHELNRNIHCTSQKF